MSGIVAAVYGTHCNLWPTYLRRTTSRNPYKNRKGYLSLKVVVAGSVDLKMVFADAKYPGYVNDFEVWQKSSLKIQI